MSIWVLTREINQYDQDGEYFVHAWTYKPSILQLKRFVTGPQPVDRMIHIWNGGGRTPELENEWYHLREIKQ